MNPREDESGKSHRRIEEHLVARMARMERTQGRLRWGVRALGLGTGVLAGLLVVAAHPLLLPSSERRSVRASGEVRADRFVLEDSTGAIRGVWQLADDGAVRLTIHDGTGRSRLNLAVLKEGSPGITLSDQSEQKRVALGLLPDQTSTLVFADPTGVPRAVLGLSRDQGANLLFADAAGVGRVALGLDASGRESAILPRERGEDDGGETEDGPPALP